jgi:hypothetical protein
MITVNQALVPLYTVASQYEYRLTYVYTNCDYTVDPLLQSPNTEFRLDPTLNKPKVTQGPAAG